MNRETLTLEEAVKEIERLNTNCNSLHDAYYGLNKAMKEQGIYTKDSPELLALVEAVRESVETGECFCTLTGVEEISEMKCDNCLLKQALSAFESRKEV